MKYLRIFIFYLIHFNTELGFSSSSNIEEYLAEGYRQVYSDKLVTFYLSKNLNESFDFPYNTLSKLWHYVTETYGRFMQTTLKLRIVLDHMVFISCNYNYEYTYNASKSLTNLRSNDELLIRCKKLFSESPFNPHLNFYYLLHKFIDVLIDAISAKSLECQPGLILNKDGFMIQTILVFDIYQNAKSFAETSVEEDLFEREMHREGFMKRYGSITYRREVRNMFLEWYYPIYTNNEGTSLLQKFFKQLCSHRLPTKVGNDSINYFDHMDVGMFVHLWSGAVGKDLKPKAIPIFGWTTEDSNRLQRAKLLYPKLEYQHETKMHFTPSEDWLEDWTVDAMLHDKNLVQKYATDYVLIYSDVNSNLTKVFNPNVLEILSRSWNYTTNEYAPLTHPFMDPKLYIIVHITVNRSQEICEVSRRQSYFDINFKNRNVIDCSFSTKIETEPYKELENVVTTLILEMGLVVIRSARETGNWPAQSVSAWEIKSIFAYDIMSAIKLQNETVTKWMNTMQNRNLKYPRLNTFWFRDWLYPIYSKYGGSTVLKRFLNLLHSEWPQKNHDYIRQMTLPELVHFWSGVAGVDLWHLASKTFGWNLYLHKQYFKAKAEFPVIAQKYNSTFPGSNMSTPTLQWKEEWKLNYNYHSQLVSLVYVNEFIAIYHDNQVDSTGTWYYEPLSKAWQYVKDTFGPFGIGEDPLLYFVLHKTDYTQIALGPPRRDTLSNNPFQNRTVIDCCEEYVDWTSTQLLDVLVEQITIIIQLGAKRTGNWPARSVAEYFMSQILIFDIYMGIGRNEDAVRFLKVKYDMYWDVQKNNCGRKCDFWLRDWFYPIFLKYGRTFTLNKFLELLYLHWPKTENGLDYAKQMNEGEFVHFWSAAAKVNLQYTYLRSFHSADDFEYQLAYARSQYPDLHKSYQGSNFTLDDDIHLQPSLLQENWFGHDQLLSLVYAEMINGLALYSDFSMPLNVEWPFSLISHTWKYIKNIEILKLNSMFQTSRRLFVILHGEKNISCKSNWNSSSQIEAINIIDCGLQGSIWRSETADVSNYLVTGFINLVLQATNLSKAAQVYDSLLMSDMLLFDIYLTAWRLDLAYISFIKTIEKTGYQSSGYIFWIRDWHIHIYYKYGGSSVLHKFMSLLSQNNHARENNNALLNVGEIVHIWSGAAGINLIYEAQVIFGWTQEYEEQFRKAQVQLDRLEYSCYSCESFQKPGLNALSTVEVAVITLSLFLIFVILIIAYSFKYKQVKEQVRDLEENEIKIFFEGGSMDRRGSVCEGNILITHAAFNKDYEIPLSKLTVYDDFVLGSGEFGIVLRGSIMKISEEMETEVITVAVKKAKPGMDVSYFMALLSELKVLSFLGEHENIVSLVAVVTAFIKKRKLLMALEYCAKGDLLKYLKTYRPQFRNLLPHEPQIKDNCEKEGSIANDKEIVMSTLNLLTWAQQISNGMAFISSKNVIHGDLAARNILLTANGVAKISDFGLSRQLVNYTTYTKKTKTKLPWKWMAIESLRDGQFSIASDIWAFGVTLYEIFSLGSNPFPGCTWGPEFVQHLLSGHRVNSPEYGNNEIYSIIMDCMKEKPSERISFSEIMEKVENIQSNLGLSEDPNLYCIYKTL